MEPGEQNAYLSVESWLLLTSLLLTFQNQRCSFYSTNTKYDWHRTRKDCCSKMNSCIEGHSFMVNVEERLRAEDANVFSKVERARSKTEIINMKDRSTTFQIYKGEVELSFNDSLTQQVNCLEDRVE